MSNEYDNWDGYDVCGRNILSPKRNRTWGDKHLVRQTASKTNFKNGRIWKLRWIDGRRLLKKERTVNKRILTSHAY